MAAHSHRCFLGMLGLAAVLVIALFAAGCTQTGSEGQSPSAPQVSTLKVTGSTTVLPIAQAAADAYMAGHATADVQVTGGGSSVGVQAIGEGTADIGMSSRDLKAEEMTRYPDLVTTTIANDGIAIIVHPSNTIASLTMAQIKAIYKGEIINWNEVGGPDQTIVVIGRDSASGTREFFSEKVMNREDFVATQLDKNSNGAVKQTVAQTPGAIGYVSLGYIGADVRAVPVIVEGTPVGPTVENVVSRTYPIARPLLMITRGTPSGLAKDYIDFILSLQGQKIVSDEGFVPV
jgi:phosphate transport system substrate-binding protein